MQIHRHVDCGLHAEQNRQTRRGKPREHIFGSVGARQGADYDEREQREQREAKDYTKFLCGDREHEIGVAVRQAALGDALARSKSEPAAIGECLHGGIDLKGVT